eukprot:PhF_6_TR40817/c0_g1_i1/m.61723/K03321/TC.SULP; sulfate permease, SulP family
MVSLNLETLSNHILTHIPIITWLPKYNVRQQLLQDVIAGLVVLVMAIPQSVAYAHLAELPSVFGMYSCIIPPLIYSCLGSSKELSVGPVAMISMLTGSAIRGANGVSPYTQDAANFALVVGCMSGLFGLAFNLLGLSKLTSYVNHCVIGGFTAAASILIMMSQLGTAFNVSPVSTGNSMIDLLSNLVSALKAQATVYSVYILLLTIGTTSTLFWLRHQKYFTIPVWFPVQFIVLVISILLSYGLDFNHKLKAQIVGPMPDGLPPFSFPKLDDYIKDAWVPALLISIIGFMEGYSVGMRVAARAKYSLQISRELTALSSANVVGSFFSAFPVTGSFSRTALNADLGASSQIAGVVVSAGMIFALTVLNRYDALYYLPKFVLTSIIVFAVSKLIDFHEAVVYWKVDKIDFSVWVVSFLATLLFGVDIGLGVAFGYSLLSITYRTTRTSVRTTLIASDTVVCKFGGSLYFTNLESITFDISEQLQGIVVRQADPSNLLSITEPYVWNVVFDMSCVVDMDAMFASHFLPMVKTVIGVMTAAVASISPRLTVRVFLTHLQENAYDRLQATNFFEKMHAEVGQVGAENHKKNNIQRSTVEGEEERIHGEDDTSRMMHTIQIADTVEAVVWRMQELTV